MAFKKTATSIKKKKNVTPLQGTLKKSVVKKTTAPSASPTPRATGVGARKTTKKIY